MTRKNLLTSISVLALISLIVFPTAAASKKNAAPQIQLTETGAQLEASYAATLTALLAELKPVLPAVSSAKQAALQQAQTAVAAAQKDSASAGEAAGEISKLQSVIANWKSGVGWMGRAKKKIAQAEADLKTAPTEETRQAAQKSLVAAQEDLANCEARIKETEAKITQAKTDQGTRISVKASADATLASAQATELAAAKSIHSDVEPFLTNEQLEAKLIKATVLTAATPRGLAAFAEQSPETAAHVQQLLADDKLMREMLVAGGAPYGKYGQAMEILAAIKKASAKAQGDIFPRLALAVALEHADPIKQSNAADQKNAPEYVDPVKRYLHYEKAYLAGELDPAFKTLNTWEYRMVVDCDAPDEILTWGREMLRNYRPDHITNPNYGWRYSAAVKTEVPYGSQNVQYDLPSLQQYQNIPKDGGVCGRRAFFGRFVLRCFGIPVWGVTQHAHAALSHWTPKGWVINLGAGFQASWWDKNEFSLSGSDFLVEVQAREFPQQYLKVLRARWVSRILGEEPYNGRKGVVGGTWSQIAHHQAIVLAAQSVELGPLGQELGEANEAPEKQTAEQAAINAADQQIVTHPDGGISIPAVAHRKVTGQVLTLQSYGGGKQMNCNGGTKAEYPVTAPRAGKYLLTARVATLQEGQKFLFAANGAAPADEVAVPYTIGMWQETKPVEITLAAGANVLNFESVTGSRGVAIKHFTLTPVN